MTDNQACAHYEERIKQKRNEITKHEMSAAVGRIQLEQLELSLSECLKGESPIVIKDEFYSHDLTEFWIGKLFATYRDNCGYTGGNSAELFGSNLERLQLCHIAAELVDLIANELTENIKVIEVMKNRNGMLTTPGNIKGSIWYLICKQRGIDLDTKSEKETPALIRKALERWPMDNAFQESNRIMRYWAQHIHQQKREASKVERIPKNEKELKEWVQSERKNRLKEKPAYFMAWIHQQDKFIAYCGEKPSDNKLGKWMRDAKKTQ